jgi:hypothetical protein
MLETTHAGAKLGASAGASSNRVEDGGALKCELCVTSMTSFPVTRLEVTLHTRLSPIYFGEHLHLSLQQPLLLNQGVVLLLLLQLSLLR